MHAQAYKLSKVTFTSIVMDIFTYRMTQQLVLPCHCLCIGKPVAFKLIPQGGPTLLAKPYSLIAKRGLFATKHLWVTPFKEEERYAAGDWVLQAEGGDGLQEWTKQVRNLGALLHDAQPYGSIRNRLWLSISNSW